MRRRDRWAAALAIVAGLWLGAAGAAEKPAELRVGVVTFLSGPASVFGEPGRQAALLLAEQLNAKGGIAGVPVALTFIDEGAGGEQLLAEYRRLVQDGVEVMFASISSGNCNKIAPLAEDLKVLNILWDCGTQTIFEDARYEYVFRTQANATPEMLSTLLYLLKNKPDFKTIAVVNQDYAWGRDSWQIFSTALKTLKPDVEIVAELFPKFGAPDYSTEVTRLSAMRPDVIFSTSWGGDLDTFMRQAIQRGLTRNTTFVLPLAESSLQRIGSAMPEGVIVGARGDHWFLHPERKDDPALKGFVEAYRAKTGAYPIYPTFHMAQAFAALEAAYAKAADAAGGWPTKEQVAAAMTGLEFTALGRPITIREDHQGLEAQLLGVTRKVDGYDFPILDQMTIFPAEAITTPVGQKSVEWVSRLTPEILELKVDTYAAQ